MIDPKIQEFKNNLSDINKCVYTLLANLETLKFIIDTEKEFRADLFLLFNNTFDFLVSNNYINSKRYKLFDEYQKYIIDKKNFLYQNEVKKSADNNQFRS